MILERANTISKIAINFNHLHNEFLQLKLQIWAVPLKRNYSAKTISKPQLFVRFPGSISARK